MEFSKKTDLSLHKKTHKIERPYKCNLCEKSFLKPSALNVHKSKKHAGKVQVQSLEYFSIFNFMTLYRAQRR